MNQRNPSIDQLKKNLERLTTMMKRFGIELPGRNSTMSEKSGRCSSFVENKDILYYSLMKSINVLGETSIFQKILCNESISEFDLTIEEQISILMAKVKPGVDRFFCVRVIDRSFQLLEKLDSRDTILHVVVYSEYFSYFEDEIIERQKKAVKFLKKAHRIISSLYPDFPFRMTAEKMIKIPFIHMKIILRLFELYNHHALGENEYYFQLERQNPQRIQNTRFVEKYVNSMMERCEEVLRFISPYSGNYDELTMMKYYSFSSHLQNIYTYISRMMKAEGKLKESVELLDKSFQLKKEEFEIQRESINKKLENSRNSHSNPLGHKFYQSLINNELVKQFQWFKSQYYGEKIKILIDLGSLQEAMHLLKGMNSCISSIPDETEREKHSCVYWNLLRSYYDFVGDVGKMEQALDKTIELNVKFYGIDSKRVIDFLIIRVKHNLVKKRFREVKLDLKRISRCDLDQRHTKWFNEESEKLRKAEKSIWVKRISRSEKRKRKKKAREKSKRRKKKEKNILCYKKCTNVVCENVESKSVKFKVCGGCKVRSYCSRKCQSEDWKNGHKKNCSRTYLK